MMHTYYDINDLLINIFGQELTEDCLPKDGGVSLWDLYFVIAQIHSHGYRRFQKLIINGSVPGHNYVFKPMLLPCCEHDKNKPVMSKEQYASLTGNLNRTLSDQEFIETMELLNDYRISDDEVKKSLTQELKNIEQADCCSMHDGMLCCRDNLLRIFPECIKEIYEQTTAVMLAYFIITETTGLIMDRFVKYHRSGLRDFTAFFGIEVESLLIRNHFSSRDSQNADGQVLEEIINGTWDYDGIYPEEGNPRELMKSVWKMVVNHTAEDHLNCELIKKQIRQIGLTRENEHLRFIEYLFGKSDYLHDVYRKNSHLVVSTYMLDRFQVRKDLASRFRKNDTRENRISLKEIMLLFLNHLPAVEDRREIMPIDVLDEIMQYTLCDQVELSEKQLLKLFDYSDQYRLMDYDLIRWTEKYFEMLMKERKDDRDE